jgi:hypothetical protein
MGIGGGDNVRMDICLDCGQVQGTYPIPQSDMELQDDEIDDTERAIHEY